LLDIAKLNDDIGTEWVHIILINFSAISLVWPQPSLSYVSHYSDNKCKQLFFVSVPHQKSF